MTARPKELSPPTTRACSVRGRKTEIAPSSLGTRTGRPRSPKKATATRKRRLRTASPPENPPRHRRSNRVSVDLSAAARLSDVDHHVRNGDAEGGAALVLHECDLAAMGLH